MLLLFFLFGIVTRFLLAAAILGAAVGIPMLFSRALRSLGVFVTLLPACGSAFAVAGSWSFAWLCDRMSHGASIDTWIRWQVLAVWAWPAGLVLGGLFGLVVGGLLAIIIVRRKRPRPAPAI